MQAVADGAAEHTAGVAVSDDTQVGPALTGVQVGDVGEPSHVTLALIEVPLDEIGNRERILATDRRRRVPGSRADPRDPIRSHQLRDRLARDHHPGILQIRVDPWGPIGAVECGVECANLRDEIHGHPEQRTHPADRHRAIRIRLLRLDHREPFLGFCFDERKAAAFPRTRCPSAASGSRGATVPTPPAQTPPTAPPRRHQHAHAPAAPTGPATVHRRRLTRHSSDRSSSIDH